MKRILSLFLTVVLITGITAGCGNIPAKNDKLSIVTTIFPEYDWVMNILGDKSADADVTMLLDNGVDLHSFQPSADDIIKISNCDLFIYVGGESDGWVKDALKESVNKNMVVINLLEVLGNSVKEEEIVEGMEAEDEENEDEDEPEYDEHVWLSLKNAEKLVSAITDGISKVDKENADIYTANASAYREKINALDLEYKTAVDNAKIKTLLFADRFPFRYLVDDYGIKYYAAFAGCSAESEASFKTVSFLAEKINQLGLSSILTLEGTNHKIAETVISASKSKNISILSVNSMQSTAVKDIENGVSYLSVMKNNLEVLKKALK